MYVREKSITSLTFDYISIRQQKKNKKNNNNNNNKNKERNNPQALGNYVASQKQVKGGRIKRAKEKQKGRIIFTPPP